MMEVGQTLLLLVVVGVVSLVASYSTTYHGHQVWRIEGAGVEEVLRDMEVEVWGHGRSWVDVQVPPALAPTLAAHLTRHALPHSLLIQDIQRLIDEELTSLPKDKTRVVFDQYNELEVIEAYLQDLATSVSWVSVESIGQTSEGRDLWVATLAVSGLGSKPTIWFDCNIHAREWISAATCVYGLDLLTTGYGNDPDVTSFLDKYDVYIMPVHNPDGYHFTWHGDRLWRKNRVLYSGNTCYGTDINRNFDDGHWGGAGTSTNPCSSIFCGPSPFSELEAQAVRNYTSQITDMAAFFSIHSFSQMWMYAFGWGCDNVPEKNELDRVSEIGATAIRAVHNTYYEYGSVCNTLYACAGTSVDYIYSRGIVHSYTIELRDTGTYGFLLPAEQIMPTVEETWAGLLAGIMAI